METNKWPVLEFEKIKDTLETLHQWIQIVGKTRLRTMPWQNHSWHTSLYISPHGFTTQSIPYEGGIFQIDFDFEKHKLILECSGEKMQSFGLKPMSVAEFYAETFKLLKNVDIDVEIHGSPNEMEQAIPFKENTVNKSYDPKAANSIWQSMLKTNNVFQQFRSKYIGKCSPVHLFWGAFDLAVTRFSGKPAPLHQGSIPNMPKDVMQEAYSHEVSSAGFWPGSPDFPFPAYYAYIYPAHPEFGKQYVLPEKAFYGEEMGEYFLKYEDVQQSDNPEETLHSFLQSTYEAATKSLGWDRKKLERD